MPKRIGTVSVDSVGHRDDVIVGSGNDGVDVGRDAIDGEAVVLECPGEHGRVEVLRRRVQQLTNDLQLARAVHTGDHRRYEVDHAVGGGEFHRRIDRTSHADAHVQRGVAVDEIVAAAAFNDIAASAADDDVAAVEAGHNRDSRCPQQIVKEVLQAVDETNVGQHAAVGAGG